VVMGQTPRAEALAANCVDRTRPVWSWFAREWRRLGTAAAVMVVALLLFQAMFGMNGMMVYVQKRAELKSVQNDVDRLQKQNEDYARRIKALKSDPAAIEKEAREQLHYTRPGEYVYVAPAPPAASSVGRAKNGN
jgi:cell division protein FtsB